MSSRHESSALFSAHTEKMRQNKTHPLVLVGVRSVVCMLNVYSCYAMLASFCAVWTHTSELSINPVSPFSIHLVCKLGGHFRQERSSSVKRVENISLCFHTHEQAVNVSLSWNVCKTTALWINHQKKRETPTVTALSSLRAWSRF